MANSSDIIKIGFDYRASLAQFEKETNGIFDGISEKAGKQKIVIQLDAKNDKVIEKIKELQKLKLDKFTFEFGDSGIKEQLKTFGQLENKINEIINLSKEIDGKVVGNGIGNSIVDEKSLNNIIDLFTKMESHLSSIKTVFADVGDGEEFYPLLKMINNVQSAISELSTSVKGIGLNMNIDIGSDSEMEAKVQSKISNALQAYQRLFDQIKMSGAGGSVINTNFFEFDINQYDTMMGKLQAYRKFIENMRNEAKSQYNGKDVLYQSVDKSYWTQASAAMGQVTKAFNEMNAASDTNPLNDLFGKTDLSEVVSQLGLIVTKLEEISTTALSFKEVFTNGFNVTTSVEEINKLTSRVKELEEELSNVKVANTSQIKDVFQGDDKVVADASTTAIKEESKALEQVSNSAKEASESKEKFAKANKEVKASADSSKTSISEEEKYFNSLGKSLGQYQNTLTAISRKPVDGNRSKDLQDRIDTISSSLDELRTLESNANKDGYVFNKEDVERGQQLEKIIKDNIEAVKQMSAAQKGSTPLSRGKTIEWANDLLKENTKWSKKARTEVQGWIDKLATADPSNVEEIRTRILEIVRAEREAGREGRTWLDIFKDKKIYSFLGQAASMFSFYDLVNLGREGFQTIRELDTALTEMRKVSDESVESLKRYQAATFDVGDAVGATAKTIQNSTADWMRLGESIDEAAESAKTANILLNVSEFDSIDEATKSLVSMSQAYQELEKIDIVDKLNNIGNNYSIATDELATGLQNAAAVLKTQGNDLDKAIALITAGNAITQDASKTSAGIRTIALRIAGTEEAKEELQELGEDVDDFVVKTASKTQQIIKDYTSVASNAYKGVDVLDANGNLRDTYDILLDIAKVYKEIQEEDKKFGTNRANALVEELAGKNRSNIASSILLNPDLLENVYKSSQNSVGSAQAELNKYLDSIDGRMTQLENRAQEFWYKVIDSDTIKNGITLLTNLLELGTDIVDTFGVLPTIMTGIGAGLAVKNVGVA